MTFEKEFAGGVEHQLESAVRIRTALASIQLLFAIPMRLPLSCALRIRQLNRRKSNRSPRRNNGKQGKRGLDRFTEGR